MHHTDYQPKPVDTDGIELSEDLQLLVEQMARNVHETWAERRMAQGWVFGETRDDKKKTHPCLVPYEELTEEERDYDRNTCISTLKFILKAGFHITAEQT